MKRPLLLWAKYEKLINVFVLIMALILPYLFNTTYVINIAVISGTFAILAMSLNFLTGNVGIVSFGHAAFFGIGAYTSAILIEDYGMPFIVSFFAATVVTAVFGILLGLPVLRLSGKYVAIATLAFCEVVRIIEVNLDWLTHGAKGISGIPVPSFFGFKFDTPTRQYYLVLGLCVLTFYVISSIMNSRIGRGITAIKNDSIAAESMGIPVTRYKLMVFAISSLLAGLGGAFYAHYVRYIDPSTFSFNQSTKILSMSILGGLGNTYGGILGAVVLTVIPELLRPIMDLREVLYGALLVVMVMARPKGILGGINLHHLRLQNDLELNSTYSQRKNKGDQNNVIT